VLRALRYSVLTRTCVVTPVLDETRRYYFEYEVAHVFEVQPRSRHAVDLQALLGKLADFLLQSGFAGGQQYDPWGDYSEEADRSLESLKGHLEG